MSGRVTDCIFRKDGSVVSPEYFIHMVGVALNSGWIRKFQVIKESYDRIRLLIVLTDPVDDPHEFFKRELMELSRVIRLAMGEDCDVQYTFVEDIPRTPSGKYRYIISLVDRLLERNGLRVRKES